MDVHRQMQRNSNSASFSHGYFEPSKPLLALTLFPTLSVGFTFLSLSPGCGFCIQYVVVTLIAPGMVNVQQILHHKLLPRLPDSYYVATKSSFNWQPAVLDLPFEVINHLLNAFASRMESFANLNRSLVHPELTIFPFLLNCR